MTMASCRCRPQPFRAKPFPQPGVGIMLFAVGLVGINSLSADRFTSLHELLTSCLQSLNMTGISKTITLGD